MKTKNIPSLVMLTAGLTASIVMFKMKYDLQRMLWILLLVFFVFFILGCIIKCILDRFDMKIKSPDQDVESQNPDNIQTGDTEEDIDANRRKAENGNTENPETENRQDGSVIEKNNR